MSLNYNLTKVINLKDNTPAVTDILIWATIFTGIDKITNKTKDEFYARLHLTELVNGPFLVEGKKPRYATRDEVYAHVGLSTNAGNFSRSEFVRRVQKRYFQDRDREVDRDTN